MTVHFQCDHVVKEGDETVHMLGHFIGAHEDEIRAKLAKWICENHDSAEEIVRSFHDWPPDYPTHLYYDYVCNAGHAIDELGIFFISYMYNFHTGIGSRRGLWKTMKSGHLPKCDVVLQYEGPRKFHEMRVSQPKFVHVSHPLSPPRVTYWKRSISDSDYSRIFLPVTTAIKKKAAKKLLGKAKAIIFKGNKRRQQIAAAALLSLQVPQVNIASEVVSDIEIPTDYDLPPPPKKAKEEETVVPREQPKRASKGKAPPPKKAKEKKKVTPREQPKRASKGKAPETTKAKEKPKARATTLAERKARLKELIANKKAKKKYEVIGTIKKVQKQPGRSYKDMKKTVTKCDTCKEDFHTVKHYDAHMLQFHPGTSFTCTKCDRTYQSQASYRKHVKHNHMYMRYSCKSCGKYFAFDYQLTQHEATHEEVSDHVCTVKNCGLNYTTASALATHMLVHKDTIYRCDKCNFETNTERNLNQHKLQHQSKKKCPQCDFEYIYPGQFTRHKKTTGHRK